MIIERPNLVKPITINLIAGLAWLIMLIFSSVNLYLTNSNILYILEHYEDKDTRFIFQFLYWFLIIWSLPSTVWNIISIFFIILKNTNTEFGLINDKLLISYSNYYLKLIHKNWNINSKNNNEINILEIKEIEIKSPNKIFKNCLFIKLDNNQIFPLFWLSNPENIKKIIENKINEIKKEF
ncbi:hypothetical protein [Mesomycoplasma molare]|uniref:DUF304 domain-containing protein n=1 Tax=Mesomycoplasma molare TaxID=171288 RepID=A0ABY5TZE3_9BACT|nr:hypothetical protein [Mesomycoplasma molare]UWD34404.1 hypothetical protein NX772_01065 [Mesomycoplasma molare]